jgi:hypothetical protein
MVRSSSAVAAATMAMALTLTACAGGDTPPVVTQTVTQSGSAAGSSNSATSSSDAAPSATPTVTKPEKTVDPFANFKKDPDSLYTVPQQKYLYALKQGINEEAVTNSEIQLVVVGGAVCSGLDDADDDKDAWQTFYDGLQAGDYVPPDIPAAYIALAAGAALCPAHKAFVLDYFDDQTN